MSDSAFEKARDRLLLACEITGLTPSALAADGKMAATTLTRPINRKTTSIPGPRTMEKVDELVRRHIARLACTEPREATKALAKWEGRAAPGAGGTGSLSPVDLGMIRVEVRGAVKAGHWASAAEWHDQDFQTIVVPSPGAFGGLFGLEVDGPSMNLEYPEGTYLICCPILSWPRPIAHGDHVIVHRFRNGEVEATVKEFQIYPDGSRWLVPKTTDARFAAPIPIPNTPPGFADSGLDEEIRIIAVVVADYRMRTRP